MERRSHMPWEWLILGILADGRKHPLPDIYIDVEEEHHDLSSKDGTQMINPTLLEVDPRWGDRPKLTHSVRTHLSKFKKAGWVERVDRGVYRITEAGKQRPKRFNE